jgi:hypothetical protein
MLEAKEEKYWILILAFAALDFAIYPMMKDFIENREKTACVMLWTLIFSLALIALAQLGYTRFFKSRL